MQALTDYRDETKEALRIKCRENRRNMPPEEKAFKDKQIAERLLNLWSLREADLILIYVATEFEVETREIINVLFKRGIPVAAPRCADSEGTMFFYRINSFDDLEPGLHGILEPIIERCEKVNATEYANCNCIVPAYLADSRGVRLGQGKGYYDMFLKSAFRGRKIGVCYESEFAEKIPSTFYDIRMDVIVTEKATRLIEKHRHNKNKNRK